VAARAGMVGVCASYKATYSPKRDVTTFAAVNVEIPAENSRYATRESARISRALN